MIVSIRSFFRAVAYIKEFWSPLTLAAFLNTPTGCLHVREDSSKAIAATFVVFEAVQAFFKCNWCMFIARFCFFLDHRGWHRLKHGGCRTVAQAFLLSICNISFMLCAPNVLPKKCLFAVHDYGCALFSHHIARACKVLASELRGAVQSWPMIAVQQIQFKSSFSF